MTIAEIDLILREYTTAVRNTTEDLELQALRTAIFVEDSFGLTLTDGQLDAGLLGDPVTLRALVIKSVGDR